LNESSGEARKRIPIPRPTKRRLLVECGHKCSIPNCPEKSNLQFHHINSDPLDNRDENLLVLCPNHHAMASISEIDRKACSLYKEGLSRRMISKPIPLKELAEIEGIYVEPETSLRKWIIRLGRKYVNWRHGKLDVSLNQEKAILAVVGLLCFVPISYQMYQLYAFKVVANTTSSLVSLLLVALGVVLVSFVFVLEKLECPNCNRNFSIRRTDSKRVERKVVYQTDTEIEIETVYRNTYECDFCGYKFNRFENVSERRDLT